MVRYSGLPATAVALLVAFFIGWLVLRVQFQRKWAGVYGDAVFTFIVVCKFSIIVTDFKAVIAQPFALLYFNSGTMGVFLGEWQHRYSFGGNDKKFSLTRLESLLVAGPSF